jgi:NAD+ synthase (glutamine-hydrolysing)
MRLALAQLNPVVGDLAGNGQRILAACRQAADQGADLVLTPELSLWGYPPRDLLLLPARLEAQAQSLDGLAASLAAVPGTPAVLVGIAEPCGESSLPRLHNALALVEPGGWRVVARKQLLPSYDVFDERRYFRPAATPSLVDLECRGRTWRLGLTICEDLWVEEELQGQRLVGPDPIAALQPLEPDLLLNLSASPFSQAKPSLRRQLASRAAGRLGCPVVYVNQVGGNDELVFDGASFVVDASGELLCRLPCCQEAVTLWDATTPHGPGDGASSLVPEPEPLEQLFRVLVLGVHDYAGTCGFQQALLGLSGGIDSALVAVIAAAALGTSQVDGLLLPSPWSSAGSIDDALALATRLGLRTHTLPIAA